MINKLRTLKIPLRLQFLVIALSLAVTSTILGLSAYLTDTDTYRGTFRTVGGDNMGFKITGNTYENEIIIPGNTVPLNVVANVEGSYGLYVFVKLDIPASFAVRGFNSNSWHPIKEGSNVYYYGNETNPVSLGGSNGSSSDILSSVILSTGAKGGENYTLTITGYAIQATNINTSTSTPEQIFNMIGDD